MRDPVELAAGAQRSCSATGSVGWGTSCGVKASAVFAFRVQLGNPSSSPGIVTVAESPGVNGSDVPPTTTYRVPSAVVDGVSVLDSPLSATCTLAPALSAGGSVPPTWS